MWVSTLHLNCSDPKTKVSKVNLHPQITSQVTLGEAVIQHCSKDIPEISKRNILPWPAENVRWHEITLTLDRNVRKYSLSRLEDKIYIWLRRCWTAVSLKLKAKLQDKQYDAWPAVVGLLREFFWGSMQAEDMSCCSLRGDAEPWGVLSQWY